INPLRRRLTWSRLRKQQSKNRSQNQTNVHHDLLCFSVERATSSALKTGDPFRVVQRESSSRPQHAEVHLRRHHIFDNGYVEGIVSGYPIRQTKYIRTIS